MPPKPRKKASAEAEQEPQMVERLEQTVREVGFLPLRQLAKETNSRAQQASIVETLVRCGLEKTATVLRVPLDVQLRAAVPVDGIPLSKLLSLVKGATNAEARSAVDALLQKRALLSGFRRNAVWVFSPTIEHLTDDEVSVLREVMASLQTLLPPTKPRQQAAAPIVLREEVNAVLRALGPLRQRERATSLLRTLEQWPSTTGLIFLPDVLRSMTPGERNETTPLLTQLAREGRLELRPESGAGTTSREELSWCPTGVSGEPLSWIQLSASRA